MINVKAVPSALRLARLTHLKIVDRLAIVDEGKCTNCNACIAKCKFDAIEAAPEAEKVDLSAYKHIWVFAEQRHGKDP